jgi:hypothetical protein
MLLSPPPFRGKVSGRAGAQPVRRCITYLLPVGPTFVGRTTLASQDAPRSVTTGELNAFASKTEAHGLAATAEGQRLGCSRFPRSFPAFPHSWLLPSLLGISRDHSGSERNRPVSIGPQTSLATSLRVSAARLQSGYDCGHGLASLGARQRAAGPPLSSHGLVGYGAVRASARSSLPGGRPAIWHKMAHFGTSNRSFYERPYTSRPPSRACAATGRGSPPLGSELSGDRVRSCGTAPLRDVRRLPPHLPARLRFCRHRLSPYRAEGPCERVWKTGADFPPARPTQGHARVPSPSGPILSVATIEKGPSFLECLKGARLCGESGCGLPRARC